MIDGPKVLISRDAPKTEKLIKATGLKVTKIDISEFEKLEGGLTCLSVRIRELPEQLLEDLESK